MTRSSASHRRSPRWLLVLLLLALGLQTAWKVFAPAPVARLRDYGPAPRQEWLHLSTLGDPVAMASVWMLWLQTFDDQAGVMVPFKHMNFHHLATWLERVLALDPRSEYPLFMAIRVYGLVPDPDRQRLMLDFVHRAFLEAPQRRWSWLVFAALHARHHLGDHERARRFMHDVEKNIMIHRLPFWAQGLHVRVLSEQNEIDVVRALKRDFLLREGTTGQQRQALEVWLEKLEEQEKILENEKKNTP
ncbi:MAG: hypothetical protein HQL64_03640 [Magnetococcales bacterium]|nr:hypothetical protein [Magnetococcales bacterium]